ncbi:putative 2-dehydropantoate 2-reductase [Capsicum chinense]|nr:putative 2-dehydropantoate 2-reductase [Capsicum chinense]
MNIDKLKKNFKFGCSKKLSAWRKRLKILGKGYLRERILMKSSQEFQKNYWGSTPDGIFNFNGYGIRSIRVDGNDALAVFTTVQEARKIVVNKHKTVLVEVNCTLFEIEAYASCGSVVNYFFYVQRALRKQSRLEAKQNASADKRHQYKGQWT